MFVFAVYRDQRLTQRLITDLRKHYVSVDLICVADDDPGRAFAAFCQSYNVILLPFQKRLKLPEFGGLWLERLLNAALLTSSSPYFIKMEGDTRFWRPWAVMPETDIAGTLHTRRGITFPRGGCVFLRRDAITKILASGLLRDDRYCNNATFSYRRYFDYRYAGEEIDRQPILLADLVLGDVIARLELSLSNWDEVSILFRGTPQPRNFAATHPHR